MSEKEKEIMKTLQEAIPHLSEKQRSYLLGYGDAVLDMKQENRTEQQKAG